MVNSNGAQRTLEEWFLEVPAIKSSKELCHYSRRFFFGRGYLALSDLLGEVIHGAAHVNCIFQEGYYFG